MSSRVQPAPNKWQQPERFYAPASLQNVGCAER